MSWTDEYREIVEFYYWEPQHIGRSLSGKRFKNADEMYAHINGLEVSLNQILNIFFSLLPLINIDCINGDTSNVLISSWQLETIIREQKNATQPDMFFTGSKKNIAIELKTGSKSSLDQVLKYVRFNQYIGKDTVLPLDLYFLTPEREITSIFKEKYSSIGELQTEIKAATALVPQIKLITYDDLFKSISRVHPNSETELRLVSGLLYYLDSRKEQLKIQE